MDLVRALAREDGRKERKVSVSVSVALLGEGKKNNRREGFSFRKGGKVGKMAATTNSKDTRR